MPRPRGDLRPVRQPGRGVACFHTLALAAAVVVVALTNGENRWNLPELAIITGLTVGSDLTHVQTGSSKLRVSGSFLGIMLAAVLLGGGPAALVGVISIALGWLHSREVGHQFRNNLATYAWFPLIGGLVFYAVAVQLTNTAEFATVGGLTYIVFAPGAYILVFIVFVLALALNFLMIAGYQCWLDGSSLRRRAEEALTPILASQLFSALLTVAAVYIVVNAGSTTVNRTMALALFGLVLVVFQYLVGALLLSQRRAETMERMATTDELTGLPNRESFRNRVQAEIEAIDHEDQTFAVMLMDLDRFKEVNDTLGHHYGDELLRQLGPRLAACVGPEGVVARLGGDEFAVLSGRTTDPDRYAKLVSRLLRSSEQPLVVDALPLEVNASIGVARFPDDGRDATELLRCADIAMYAAKESQTGSLLYTPELDRHSLRRLNLLSDVRRAIESTEVIVHYQPMVRLDDMSVHGAEALVRWQHPTFGLLPPSSFIRDIEQTGLIRPLTRHVLDRAIEQCAAWWHAGRHLTMAVNLSVGNLMDRDLPNEIERMLAAYDLPPQALQLELTESMIMLDPDGARSTLMRLSRLGVRISVDDFGTGFSSLEKLQRLPIDELKIDQTFVTQMLHDESNLIIVRSVVNLGHDLGLKVIAEGVEDDATLRQLTQMECDLAQGFVLSRPLAPQAFDEWLTASRWGLAELPSATPIATRAAGGGLTPPAAA